MNMGSKRLFGLAGGAAVAALTLGAVPASAVLLPGQLELNTAATNCGNNNTCTPAGTGANVAADPGGGSDTPGTFTTDGGVGWANLAVTLTNGSGTETSGAANYELWGSVNIDAFTNVTLGTATKTGVGSDGNNWVFVTTAHITGAGTWSNGFFTAGTPTVELDLWAMQGGVANNNFGGAPVSGSATGLDDFANLGFSTQPAACYEGGAANAANTCLLLAQTSSQLAGTTFTIDDSAQESKDNIAFNISTNFTGMSWAVGTNGFFVQPPDPSSFGLIVISGCEAGTPQTVNIGDGNQGQFPNFFQTATQQSGAAPCNSTGVDNQHDPVGWKFATTTVPEPATLALLGTALVGLGIIRRRRNGTPV